jgi:hypothetical protein
LHFFWFVMVVVKLLARRGRFCKLFCNVVRILAGSLAWSFSEASPGGEGTRM